MIIFLLVIAIISFSLVGAELISYVLSISASMEAERVATLKHDKALREGLEQAKNRQFSDRKFEPEEEEE